MCDQIQVNSDILERKSYILSEKNNSICEAL